MRVLICGGRNYSDWHTFHEFMWNLAKDRGPFTAVIHGGARGADAMAGMWVKGYDPKIEERYDADWATYGRIAGPIRNKKMLVEGRPDLVVAFPGGKGTNDMANRAKDAGVEVIRVPSKTVEVGSLWA